MTNNAKPDFSALLTCNADLDLLARLNFLADYEIKSLDQLRPSININVEDNEKKAADWLINLFDTLFAEQNVQLLCGEHEPEYFPAHLGQPARIEFAHGFFASALHEISHWCIAGNKRRQLSDFGYWYAADGRSVTQQNAFERVEIKPQALECLFTLACKRSFQVSQDNLFANFDTSNSTFANDVYQQATQYLAQPQTLPRDAQILLRAILTLCNNQSLTL